MNNIMKNILQVTVCIASIMMLCTGNLNAQNVSSRRAPIQDNISFAHNTADVASFSPDGSIFRGENSPLIYTTSSADTDVGVFKTTVGGYHLPGQKLSTISLSYQAMVAVGGTIYVITYDPNTKANTFGTLNPETGVFTLIGNTSCDAISMALHPITGEVYVTQWASSSSSPFGKLNLTDGSFQSIGSVPGPCYIAIDNSGTCYRVEAFSVGGSRLGTINLLNGACTFISNELGLMNGIQDINIDFDTDILYHAHRASVTSKTVWRTINKTTGIPTVIGNFPERIVESFVIMSNFTPPTPCPAVTNVTAVRYEGNKVKVTWTAPPTTTGLTHYKVYYGANNMATVSAGTTEWISGALLEGTYTFSVEAIYNDDCTPVKWAAAPISIRTCYKAVSNLAVQYAADCSKATLTWEPPAKSIARGFCYHNSIESEYIQFDSDDIKGFTTINTEMEDIYGGGYLDGKLYCYKHDLEGDNCTNCYFLIVDSETGTIISTVPRPELYGEVISSVCYDYSSKTMFALQCDPNRLSKVDLATGVLTQVAMVSGLINEEDLLLTFAIDLDGNAYCIEASLFPIRGKLYSINLTTAVVTPIGSTGYGVNYAQSMAFDYNDPKCPLYWAVCGDGGQYWSTVNTITGECTFIEPNTKMEITALHFPYDPTKRDLTNYNVYLDGVRIAGPITETTFECLTFNPQQKHSWSVAVVCPLHSGTGDWTTKVDDACKGENINEHANSVGIYPNPTSGELRIENGELRIENVEVFDVFGRNILLPTCPLVHSPTATINISHLSPGIYFIRIQTENGVIMKKIIKQ
jgi:hypothetical protein